MRRIGSAAGSGGTALTLRLPDGSIRVMALEPASIPDPGDRHNPALSGYTVLIPDDIDLPARWLHVLDGVRKPPAIYTRPTDVSASWLDGHPQLLHIRSNAIDSLGQTPLERKLGDILTQSVVASRPKFVIVDLRLNNEGKFLSSHSLRAGLPRLMPPAGRIFVLISRATFSAALVTAAMLKGAGREQVTFIGETMGDAGHFRAEGGISMLPNSHITVRYSDQFEDYESGCTDPHACFWGAVAFGPRNISLAPDVRIDVPFSDYSAGRDPVLETALGMTR